MNKRYIVKALAGMFYVYDTVNLVSSRLYMEWEAQYTARWLNDREEMILQHRMQEVA